MNKAKRALRAADEFQQRHAWLAFPIAVWKKFGDDQAGNLAMLVAWFAFVSIFPLMLVLVTVLDIVLKNNPDLRHQLLDSALEPVPADRPAARATSARCSQTGLPLVVGLVGTFLGALGVANAMQNALNSAWEIPYARRPGIPVVVAAQHRADHRDRRRPDRNHGPVHGGRRSGPLLSGFGANAGRPGGVARC